MFINHVIISYNVWKLVERPIFIYMYDKIKQDACTIKKVLYMIVLVD